MRRCSATSRIVTTMKTIWASLSLIAVGTVVGAAECRTQDFEGTPFTICEAHAGEDLRLWLKDESGALIGTPERLEGTLGPGEKLIFAMNAGMYAPDRNPVGLYVEQGEEQHRIVTGAGPGNFGMVPNGVFCIGEGWLSVIESEAYAAEKPDCTYATQSGPMLVIAGALHPRFLPESDSAHIRNGVGVSPDGQTAWFAISDAPVTFHRFARLFRDVLGAPNALYLDGSISRLIAPGIGRVDLGVPMGPIVGVVAHD